MKGSIKKLMCYIKIRPSRFLNKMFYHRQREHLIMINGVNSSGTPNNPKCVHTQNRVSKFTTWKLTELKRKNREIHMYNCRF